MRVRVAMVSIMVSVIGLAACGSDTNKTAEYTKAFTSVLDTDSSTKYTTAEAGCVAPRLVEALTVERLEKSKITVKQVGRAKAVDDLGIKPTAAEATAIADAIVQCVDPSRSAIEAAVETNAGLRADKTGTECLKKELRASSDYRDEIRDRIQKGRDYKASADVETRLLKTFGTCKLEFYSRADYVDAVSSDIADGDEITPDEAECVVESLLDKITIPKLESKGVTPEIFGGDDFAPKDYLTNADAQQVGDKLVSCLDIAKIARAELKATGIFDNLPEALSTCLFNKMASDPEIKKGFRALFVSQFLGGDVPDSDIDFVSIGERIGKECAAGV